ncbi:MAG: hypothetical protein H3Z53_09240 [archaeon]|nr:hypothetical protein [archaeon]MCP8314538.1 hypothetical protein [archaeon]
MPRVTENQLLKEELLPKRWKRVPEVKYEIPVLPVEELKEPERTAMIGWLVGIVEADGSVHEEVHMEDKIKKINRWLYRYEYLRPSVSFTSTTYELLKQWCRLLGITPPKKPPEYAYTVRLYGARAIACILLMRSYLIRLRDKAEKILKKYRERPAIKLR